METLAHQRLKTLAVRSLRQWGASAVTCEVMCPINRFRADVAAWIDRTTTTSNNHRPERCPPRTIIIECKQARADFLRDVADAQQLIDMRQRLDRIRRSIEENHVRNREPDLRRDGTTLFPELDAWDFNESRHPSYRRVLRKLRQIDKRLHGQTKFCRMSRYRLADHLYLAAPEGMIRKREVPPGWGLLECPPIWLEKDEVPSLFEGPRRFNVKIAAPNLNAPDKHRQRMLRNIAIAASWKAAPDSMLRPMQEKAERASSTIEAKPDTTRVKMRNT